MIFKDRFVAGLARQLGRPEGLRGRLVGIGLNRGNHDAVAAAVAATEVGPGQVVADIGFGGGLGLRLLLDRVGVRGHVHGVELSATMLAAARRRHRAEGAQGRLDLHEGTMDELPLADDSLDGLITVNTIYFVDDLSGACREMARVTRPSGRVVVGLGDPHAMASTPVVAHGFRVRAVDEVIGLLTGAGLADVRHERVGDADAAFHLLVARRPD